MERGGFADILGRCWGRVWNVFGTISRYVGGFGRENAPKGKT